ncbi:histidine phosphatase family protein [Paenibacillaceae bacterium]|nr:histidine phosphatase family protein [Paenibacillaceae bacterium]
MNTRERPQRLAVRSARWSTRPSMRLQQRSMNSESFQPMPRERGTNLGLTANTYRSIVRGELRAVQHNLVWDLQSREQETVHSRKMPSSRPRDAVHSGNRSASDLRPALAALQARLPAAELYLLRHGKTNWNLERRYGGRTDLPLAASELHLLDPARKRLAGMAFEAVYCSDLCRTYQTLEAVRPDLAEQAVRDTRLRELDFGNWEGCTYEQLKHQALYCAWLDEPEHHRPPEGESIAQLRERIRSFLEEALPDLDQRGTQLTPRRMLIVSHGGAIRMMLSLLLTGHNFWDGDAPCGSLLAIGGGRPAYERLV